MEIYTGVWFITMNNELFEYKYIESNSMSNMAIITKWFICAGNIEIPQTIGNNTIVFGIVVIIQLLDRMYPIDFL